MTSSSSASTLAAATPSTSILRGMGIALCGYAAFSSHDALVKVLQDYSVFQIIFFAMLFGFVPLALLRLLDKRPLVLRPVQPGLVLLRAVLMVVAMALAFIAFTLLPMVQVYILLFTTPLLIALLAIPLLGERVTAARAFSIILGLCGVIIVLRPTPQSLEWGHLAAMLSALTNAVAMILSRKVGQQESSLTLIITPLLVNILASGAVLAAVYKPMPLSDLGLMFLLGVLGLIGQFCVLTGYRNAPAAVVAPMQYSQLLWAILFGVFFFNESVDTLTLVGASITVLSGVLMVWNEGRKPRAVASTPSLS